MKIQRIAGAALLATMVAGCSTAPRNARVRAAYEGVTRARADIRAGEDAIVGIDASKANSISEPLTKADAELADVQYQLIQIDTSTIAAPDQIVRIGNEYGSLLSDVRITSVSDPLLHAKNLANGTYYWAVFGQTAGETAAGRAEYMVANAEVNVHGGWSYLSGYCPKGRTKRIRITGHGTSFVIQVVLPTDPGMGQEDGIHRVYFMSPSAGKSLDVELLSNPTGSQPVHMECTASGTSSGGSGAPNTAYVLPNQECYIDVPLGAQALKASDVQIEPTGAEPGNNFPVGPIKDFIDDVTKRVLGPGGNNGVIKP